MFLLNYFSKTNTNPYLIYGLIDGSKAIRVNQDPKDEYSVQIMRSNNKPTGIECTWSVWLFIDQVGTSSTDGNDLRDVLPEATSSELVKYRHIFHKGTLDGLSAGMYRLHNAPGVYLSNNANPTLRIQMDTVNGDPAVIDINNIPLKKWFHLLLRLQNNSMDVYVNGIISAHTILESVPKQNYYDVFICANGGFSGSLSNLRYYASALNIFAINAIVSAGPNLTPSTSKSVGSSSTAKAPEYGSSYLSTVWYNSKL